MGKEPEQIFLQRRQTANKPTAKMLTSLIIREHKLTAQPDSTSHHQDCYYQNQKTRQCW